MIMSIEEAREVLRICDNYSDLIIIPLLEAIPKYLESTTGKSWDTIPVHPLAKTTAGFILMSWFDGTEMYDRTIKALLTSLMAIGTVTNE